jgi:hypothetical protein
MMNLAGVEIVEIADHQIVAAGTAATGMTDTGLKVV